MANVIIVTFCLQNAHDNLIRGSKKSTQRELTGVYSEIQLEAMLNITKKYCAFLLSPETLLLTISLS